MAPGKARADHAARGVARLRFDLHRRGPEREGGQRADGHSSIAITFDTYGHLFEGSEAEAAELVGAYLEAQREHAAEQLRAAEPARAGG